MDAKVKTFWITNICNRNVSLADLNVTVPAFSSINLLDKRHYSYNLPQLLQSQKNGSLFKKSKIIVVRHKPPEVIKNQMPILKETHIPSREHSVLQIKEEKYEELEIKDQKVSDEEYAQDNAELAELDEKKPFTEVTAKEIK